MALVYATIIISFFLQIAVEMVHHESITESMIDIVTMCSSVPDLLEINE